jgi:hypothetical protein
VKFNVQVLCPWTILVYLRHLKCSTVVFKDFAMDFRYELKMV